MRLLAFTGIYKFLRVTGGSLWNKLDPDTASGNVVGNVSEVCASGLFPGRRNAGSLEERGVLHDDLIQEIAGHLVVEILILPDFIGYIRHQSRTLNDPLEALANPVEHIPGIAAQAKAADSAIRNYVGRAGKLRHGIVHSGIFTDVFPQELNGTEAQQQGIQGAAALLGSQRGMGAFAVEGNGVVGQRHALFIHAGVGAAVHHERHIDIPEVTVLP